MKKLRDLDFYLLNTKTTDDNEASLVERAFRFWQDSWQTTFKNLNVEVGEKLYADDFLDREAMALFEGKKPVALFFNSWFELRESQLNHSYFKSYPKQVISKLNELGFYRTMILSYMTVHPEYRRSETDLPISELLFSLGVLRFKTVPHEVLTGYIRTDLSFHKVFENHGGIKLEDSRVYNVGVDYLYLTKASARLSPILGVADCAEYLWSKRIQNTKTKRVA